MKAGGPDGPTSRTLTVELPRPVVRGEWVAGGYIVRDRGDAVMLVSPEGGVQVIPKQIMRRLVPAELAAMQGDD